MANLNTFFSMTHVTCDFCYHFSESTYNALQSSKHWCRIPSVVKLLALGWTAGVRFPSGQHFPFQCRHQNSGGSSSVSCLARNEVLCRNHMAETNACCSVRRIAAVQIACSCIVPPLPATTLLYGLAQERLPSLTSYLSTDAEWSVESCVFLSGPVKEGEHGRIRTRKVIKNILQRADLQILWNPSG
jgi:hypothetical protein